MLQVELRPMDFGEHPMPITPKITVALNFYHLASDSFQGSTGNMCGVSLAAAYHCIKEVTNVLFKRAGDYVSYGAASSLHQQEEFPFHLCTIGLQTLKVLPAGVCPLPGKQPQCLHGQSQEPQFSAPRSLAGMDSQGRGLHIENIAMTPVRNPRTAAEERYNACHGSSRATIEQAIGLLKMSFWCLDRSGGALQYVPARVSCIVVVCCALHQEDMIGHHLSTDEEDVEEATEQATLDRDSLSLETRAIERHAREARHNLIHTCFLPP
ncbi:putative nuclease HARBI1 [Heterodontus francisci]|uniref:putative nuclease HARBI1 n=1 Tax=Heterodontus francisci TaxID=7792 RepID=UPI00355B5FA3